MIILSILLAALAWCWVCFQLFSLADPEPSEPTSLLGWIWYPVGGLRAIVANKAFDLFLAALILFVLTIGAWTLCDYARLDADLPAPVRSASQ